MNHPPQAPSVLSAATRWTLVLRARGQTPEARAALSDLCAAYYAPVEAFIRGEVADREAARDLTQEFFARLLAGSGIAGADATRGRFRSYLFGAVKHFLQSERKRRLAAKRGGGVEHVHLTAHPSDTRAGAEPADPKAEPASRAFDRHWANALLARALDRLGAEMAAAGRQNQFETLKPCLLGTGERVPQSDLAHRLGMNESALKVAVHRLRRRFRETVRDEIAETLKEPAQVDEEMRHLIEALREGQGAHGTALAPTKPM